MSTVTINPNEVSFVNTSNPNLGTNDKPHYVPNIKLSTSNGEYIFPTELQPKQVVKMMTIRTQEATELSEKTGKPQPVKFMHDKGVYYAGTRDTKVNKSTGEVFYTCVYKSKERHITQQGIVL